LLTAVLALAAALLVGRPAALPPGQILAVGSAAPWPEAVESAADDASSPPLQMSLREWKALVPHLEQAAKADATDAVAQRRLAMAYLNVGRFDDAASIYKKLLATKEDAVVRNRLGNVYRAQGDLSSAETAYRQAMKTDPTLVAPYLNLAELYWRQHRDQDALAVLTTGLSKVAAASRPPLDQAVRVVKSAGSAADATTPPSTASASTTPVSVLPDSSTAATQSP
jgi:tetratricopeptide (TPR) repeat protein